MANKLTAPTYDEEKIKKWETIDSTETKLAYRNNTKIAMDVSMVLETGSISGYVYSYSPMFHMYTFLATGKRFDAHFNLSNATVFGSILCEIVKPRSINTYFFQSDATKSWGVRSDYHDKCVWKRNISKALSIEITPAIDDRLIPCYDIRFIKDEVSCIVTLSTSEWDMIYQKIVGFTQMCPYYAESHKFKAARERMESLFEEIPILKQIMFELAKKINDVSDKLDNSDSKLIATINTAIGTAISTAINMKFPTGVTQVQEVKAPEVILDPNLTMSYVSEEDDGSEISESVATFTEADFDAMIPTLDESKVDIPVIKETKYSDERGVPMLEHDVSEKSLSKNVIAAITMSDYVMNEFGVDNKDTTPVDFNIEDEYQLINANMIENVAKKRLSENIRLKNAMLTNLKVPAKYSAILSEEEYKKPETCFFRESDEKYLKFIPAQEESIISGFNREAKGKMLEKLQFADIDNVMLQEIEKKALSKNWRTKFIPVSEHAVGSQRITHSMLFSSVLPGYHLADPIGSICLSAAVFATAYDLFETAKNDKEKEQISANCIIDLINGDTKLVEFGGERFEKYKFYRNVLEKQIFKSDNVESEDHYMRRLAAGIMILKNTYEYSSFDINLDDELNEKQRSFLIRGLSEVYCILWYATKEHIYTDKHSNDNIKHYDFVNSIMYRFVRSLLVNIKNHYIRTNNVEVMDRVSVQFAAAFKLFELFLQKSNIDTIQYQDAVRTFFVISRLSEMYVVNKETEVDPEYPNYIKDTQVTNGLRYEKFYENVKRGGCAAV